MRSSNHLGDEEVKEFNVELERRVLGDNWRVASSAISVIWGADQSGLLTLGKLRDSFVPSADDLSNSDLELEWSSLLHGRIEN